MHGEGGSVHGPVNNLERISLLLREKLAERAKAAHRGQASTNGRQPSAPSSVAALAALGGVDDRQFRRAVIQSVLVGHFGREVMNDAAFQQIVAQVTDALEGDEEARQMLDRAAGELRLR